MRRGDKLGEVKFWYTRRAGKVRGPFPAALISRYLLLGRLQETDELSHDQRHWQPVHAYPELIPEIMRHVVTPGDRERLLRARLYEDERAATENDDNAEASRQPDRRAPEPEVFRQHRARRRRLLQSTEALSRFSPHVLVTGLLVLIAALFVYAWQHPAPTLTSDRDCRAPAAPNVNWSSCTLSGIQAAGVDLRQANLSNADLRNANLRGSLLARADLSYAVLTAADLRDSDLRGARMKGVSLRGAALSRGRLDGADLSYANLRGADAAQAAFVGADLSKAIWMDGRICAPRSIGRCR